MRIPTPAPLVRAAALALAACLVPPGMAAEQDAVRKSVQSGQLKPLNTIIADVSSQYGGRVLDVETKRGRDGDLQYEIKLINARGEKQELLIDAATGAVVPKERSRPVQPVTIAQMVQYVRKLEQSSGARVTNVEFERDAQGNYVYEAQLSDKPFGEVKLMLSVATGEVLNPVKSGAPALQPKSMAVMLESLQPRYNGRVLEAAGFAVDQEHDGEAASVAGTVEVYSAAVLDLGLPRKDGLSVLRDWREAGCTWPVLVLTARNRWSDKVAGFNAGADDYMTKPFLMDEVVLRLRAMLRRTAGAASAVLRVGQLEYDVVHGRFNLQGQGLQLTAQEHKILAFFMHHPGKLLTRSEISENVYARDLDPDSNTLDVLIGRIRRKLGGAAQLVTERGQGFRLLASDEAAV